MSRGGLTDFVPRRRLLLLAESLDCASTVLAVTAARSSAGSCLPHATQRPSARVCRSDVPQIGQGAFVIIRSTKAGERYGDATGVACKHVEARKTIMAAPVSFSRG